MVRQWSTTAKGSIEHARDCLRDAMRELESMDDRDGRSQPQFFDELDVEANQMAIIRVQEAIDRLTWVLEGSV